MYVCKFILHICRQIEKSSVFFFFQKLRFEFILSPRAGLYWNTKFVQMTYPTTDIPRLIVSYASTVDLFVKLTDFWKSMYK